MGWDASPRTIQSDVWDRTSPYPWTQILIDNTPAAFRDALAEARDYASARELPMITLNAWNEWTEGSYLEPDSENGMGYLEAVKEVFPPETK